MNDASWHRMNMNRLIMNEATDEKSWNFKQIKRRPRRRQQALIILRTRPPRGGGGGGGDERTTRHELQLQQPLAAAAHQQNDLIIGVSQLDSSLAAHESVNSRGAIMTIKLSPTSRRWPKSVSPATTLAIIIWCLLVNCRSSIYCLQSEINVAASGATNLVSQQQPAVAMNSLPLEARAATDLPTRAQANAFDLMANYLLANLANNQPNLAAAAAANQAAAGNSFMNNQRRIQLNQQQQQQPQLSPSTPANPFLIPNFQPTRRQVMQLNPNNNNNNNNLFLVASSSPPTPHLTLNRLASLANQQNRNNQPFNVNGGHSMQNNNNNNLNNGNRQQANSNRPANLQPRGQQPQPQQQQQPQPQRPLFSQGQSPPGFRPVQVPAIPMASNPATNANQPRPMSGFAPSGPPPSAANSNNAMVVVQSPPNAIGQLAPSESPASSPPPTTTTGTSTSQTTMTTGGANRGNSDDQMRSRPPASGQQQAADEAAATTTTVSVSSSSSSVLNVSSSPATDSQAEFERERDRQTTNPSSSSSTLIATTDNKSTSAEPMAPTTQAAAAAAAAANGESGYQPAGTEWNPVQNRSETGGAAEQAATRRRPSSLAPSPDIVTVPPDYNPEAASSQPQSYDISVSAQMGGPTAKNSTGSQVGGTEPLRASPATLTLAAPIASVSSSGEPDLPPATVAPTAVTTIFWSPSASNPPSSSSSGSGGSIQPSRVLAADSTRPSSGVPNRIRDSSAATSSDDDAAASATNPAEQAGQQEAAPAAGVVYGKPQARDSKPLAPGLVSPSPVANRAASIESSVAGRPFIQPVQIDNQVRPYAAASQHQSHPSILKSNHGHHHHHQQQQHQQHSATPFKPSKPLNAPISVGSGFTIVANGNQTMPSGDIQDYVANQAPLLVPSGGGGGGSEPTISAQGGPDPQQQQQQQQQPPPSESTGSNQTVGQQPAAAPQPSRIRRPTFRPKPKDPIQIDSCLPGDASSCDQAHNEHCHREFGISSCHCRPGYARLSQLRGYCSPISLFQLNLKIDRLSDERPLVFNASLQDSNNVEYQYLEFETIQAIAGAIQQTALAKQFMGAKVNKFFERKGKVWANISINLESPAPPAASASSSSTTNGAAGGQQQLTRNNQQAERLQSLANQELARLAQLSKPGKPLGDSTIMLDGSRESVSKLHDVDECASRELNDCARNGSVCTNELGGFQCQCLPGYQDMHSGEERSRHGRACLGCPASYCSNRGECLIQPDGQKQCHCRPNFYGARCDIDSEVVIVAMAGALVGVVILIITCWCFFMFNRRWKREQQKMDAMSATSGLTFNYVNSTMGGGGGGLHRSGGHQVGQMAASYMGHRFGGGAALMGGHKGASAGYDQQAIIGSTSSGSSASSQAPLGCNPYAPAALAAGHYAAASHYDDAGLLIAPASAGSSEQTSPSANSYRGIIQQQQPGNSYTLSGHHHAHHQHHHAHSHAHQLHQQHQLIQHQPSHRAAAITQFNPAAVAADYCQDAAAASNRWRTLQPGYYLSPDMLMGAAGHNHHHQQHHHHHHQLHQQQQQLYASPQRELCIDTGQSRKQRGRRAS